MVSMPTDTFNQPTQGLTNRQIALWASHGAYFDNLLGEWDWQRPLLFGQREDWLTARGFVLPYLIPMLENAGATIYYPRERDTHAEEVVLETANAPGGSYDVDMAEPGEYAIYIRYAQASNPKAELTVNHDAGATTINFDQTRGGGLWQYIGTYPLGYNNSSPKPTIELSLPKGQERETLCRLTGVKIGGGIGRSGNPRCDEGARYWLEYAGFDTEIYAPLGGEDQYREDIRCRPNWANYLARKTSTDSDSTGLGIPIDLALAIHTDAGIAEREADTFGTLGIYYAPMPKPARRHRRRRRKPRNVKPSADEKLARSILGSVVRDIRELHDYSWPDRGLRNRGYYECKETQVPAMILEMMSHENAADMRLASEPQFRFDMSRAIYKGVLRYLYDGEGCAVAPLPPRQLGMIPLVGRDGLRLTWSPTVDSLEPTATPTAYIIEEQKEGEPYIPIAKTKNEFWDAPLTSKPVAYRIRAVNQGGKSFPSNVLVVKPLPHHSFIVYNSLPLSRPFGHEYHYLYPVNFYQELIAQDK